jgi:hypothetical protein
VANTHILDSAREPTDTIGPTLNSQAGTRLRVGTTFLPDKDETGSDCVALARVHSSCDHAKNASPDGFEDDESVLGVANVQICCSWLLEFVFVHGGGGERWTVGGINKRLI